MFSWIFKKKINDNCLKIKLFGITIYKTKSPSIISGYLDNKVIIYEEDGTERVLSKKETIDGLKIRFEGINNIVKLHKPFNFNEKNKSMINVIGNKNCIEIKKASMMPVNIYIYMKEDCQTLFIDENCSFGEVTIHMQEYKSSVKIGKNCMFSAGIFCLATDGHAIFKEGKIINKAKGVVIGDNVWVGRGCYITKNAKIPNGCVVGLGSVVANTANIPENSIIAGNPAKVVKSDISWKRNAVSYFINNEI